MNAIAQPAAGNFTQHQTASAGWKLWTGRVLSMLLGAFFLFDAVMKFVKPAAVVTATLQLGFRESSIVPIGLALLACTVLYFVPRSAVFGALLLTGYLGGAVASQVRIGAPSFNILFPIVFASLVWTGLYLRDERVRALLS
ncbi:DoxX family protein [Occallatibacter riparius]|uniref:DoxX family protein n=1 Tax=Occallatibacter riparius TaxID=1002689 RepID=A0A9J7BWB1_9BACT|nr:DoxX family protein [Occallatibacter riparius]UWZ85293.1 DoxX family protein [Occallatibacter riparius]